MGRVCNVRQVYARVHYISADPEGYGRIILNVQEPHHRATGELLVEDVVVIRATLEQRCTFFVACATPDRPTVVRAAPLHFTDALSAGHLCGQLAGGIHLARAYLRTK